MSPRAGSVARTAAGAGVLAAVVWWVGPAPFVTGVRSLDPATLLAVGLLTALATLANAWRWSRVAACLGAGVAPAVALRACYRAQLLNLTLPGGVLGDVHRGLRHGRDTGETSRALRSVAWERLAGQLVQVVVLVVVLLVLPGPFTPVAAAAATACLLGAGALVVLRHRLPRWRPLLTAGDDVRRLLVPDLWPTAVALSLVALAAHVATLVVAARAVGVTAPLAELVPVALLVLGAAALPTSLAGWGPREGMAVAGFAAAGLGAEAGAATATAFGLLVLAAHLPAVVLLLPGRRPSRVLEPVPAVVPQEASR